MLLAACEPPAPAPVVIAPPAPPILSAAPPPATAKPAVDVNAVYTQISPDLQACYRAGLAATPEMADAKLTLEASFDAHGAASCAVSHDDAGFTQDVADCMTAALGRTSLEGAPRLVTLPIVARSTALSLGAPLTGGAALASVETVRMPDAFDVIESLEPAMSACVHTAGATAKSMIVAARVGASGNPECALATLPAAPGECAANVLYRAKFPPPKRGSGVVVVPILLQ